MAGQQYKAKYDHVATAEGTLSFKTGDQFTLVRKTNNDWWMVRSMSGDTGLAPVSYLEVSQSRLQYCMYVFILVCNVGKGGGVAS